MTVINFTEKYKQRNLINIGSTALRNYIKENKLELEKEKIVKFAKKLNSLSIDIIDEEKLLKKLS